MEHVEQEASTKSLQRWLEKKQNFIYIYLNYHNIPFYSEIII